MNLIQNNIPILEQQFAELLSMINYHRGRASQAVKTATYHCTECRDLMSRFNCADKSAQLNYADKLIKFEAS